MSTKYTTAFTNSFWQPDSYDCEIYSHFLEYEIWKAIHLFSSFCERNEECDLPSDKDLFVHFVNEECDLPSDKDLRVTTGRCPPLSTIHWPRLKDWNLENISSMFYYNECYNLDSVGIMNALETKCMEDLYSMAPWTRLKTKQFLVRPIQLN